MIKTRAASFDEAQPAKSTNKPYPTSFIRQKIVRFEEVGITFDGSEGTIGVQVDRMIGAAMENGMYLGEITVSISEEDWGRLR